MSLELTAFRPQDLDPLVELMSETHRLEQLSRRLLEEKIVQDPGFLPDLAVCARDGGRLAGFAMAVIRSTGTGYIKLLAVAEPRQGQGIGAALYLDLEKKLAAWGSSRLRVYDSAPNYLLPGVDPRYTTAVCFFERRGFRRCGEAVNMSVDLPEEGFPCREEARRLSREGLTVRRARPDDQSPLLQFMAAEFAVWQSEAAAMVGRQSLFLAEEHGQIVGFAGYDGNNVGLGWFGPMGVQGGFRGRGLGSLLLKTCLSDMGTHYQRAVIPWVGPIAFYARTVGARVEHLFWQYEKEIEKSA